jgi:SAM-dependent methyltransferase
MGERETREKHYYDNQAASGSAERSLIYRFSQAFYEKGSRGRLWTPFWEAANLQGAAVLDYGCGDGRFSLMIARRGSRVFGIDISPKLIEAARASALQSGFNGNGPQFMVGDANHTPYGTAMFDYVVGNGVLHHLDLDRALAEIARVLKPGGKAVFLEPMHHHPLLRALRRLTPKSHTADERPLSWANIESPRKGFRASRHREHFLFAVCAAPAHLLGKHFALTLIGALDRIDQHLMRIFPWLRRYAWLTVLEMEK